MLRWRLGRAARAAGVAVRVERRVLLEGPRRAVWRNVLDLVAGPWILTTLVVAGASIVVLAWAPDAVRVAVLGVALVPPSMYGVAAAVRLWSSLGRRGSAEVSIDPETDDRLLTGMSLAGYALAVVLCVALAPVLVAFST